MYSQNDEEKVIVGHFKERKGSFLDIGAFDGKTFSNTYRLVELGWAGICVEPSPRCFIGLLENHKSHPGIVLVNAAVGKQRRMTPFFDSGGDAISTTSPAHKLKWESGYRVKYQEFHVLQVSISEITGGAKFFDFVNIDVESTNLEVLEMFAGEGFSCEMLCVEHDSHFKEMAALLGAYQEVHRNGENTIFVKK